LKRWKLFLAILVLLVMTIGVPGITKAATLGERPLRIGMTGDDVRQLQVKLAAVGFDPGPIDGSFGKMTDIAVTLLQHAKQLPVDGVVGAETLRLLDTVAAMDASSRGQIRYKKVMDMEASAYSAASAGGNITYSGTTLRRGIVAVDPKVIPLGTHMYIEGYGYAVAEDIGGAVKGARIDVAMQTNAECFQWGVRDVKVYIFD
jgi:3D (Asp-Asp-Asp) domain-containing protein